MSSARKRSYDIFSFHTRAREAAEKGLTAKEFAKQEHTLTNNINARLYECILANLPPVKFKEPESGSQRRRGGRDDLSQITLYTGRAKVPYLTLKVPSHVVEKVGKRGDWIEWSYTRGRIVGKRVDQDETGAPQFEDGE